MGGTDEAYTHTHSHTPLFKRSTRTPFRALRIHRMKLPPAQPPMQDNRVPRSYTADAAGCKSAVAALVPVPAVPVIVWWGSYPPGDAPVPVIFSSLLLLCSMADFSRLSRSSSNRAPALARRAKTTLPRTRMATEQTDKILREGETMDKSAQFEGLVVFRGSCSLSPVACCFTRGR